MEQQPGPKHFSMIRGFHLADFFTLANVACGYFVCCGVSRLARFNVTAETLAAGSMMISKTLRIPKP